MALWSITTQPPRSRSKRLGPNFADRWLRRELVDPSSVSRKWTSATPATDVLPRHLMRKATGLVLASAATISVVVGGSPGSRRWGWGWHDRRLRVDELAAA